MFSTVNFQKLFTFCAILHATFPQMFTSSAVKETDTAAPAYKLTSIDHMKHLPTPAPTVADEVHEDTTPHALVDATVPTINEILTSNKPMTSTDSVVSQDSDPRTNKSARMDDNTTPNFKYSDKNSTSFLKMADKKLTEATTSFSSVTNSEQTSTNDWITAIEEERTVHEEGATPTIEEERTTTKGGTTPINEKKTTFSTDDLSEKTTTYATESWLEDSTPSSTVSSREKTQMAASFREGTTPFTSTAQEEITSQASNQPIAHSNSGSASSPLPQSVKDMLATQQGILQQLQEHIVHVNYRLDMQQASIDAHEQALSSLTWDVGELKETQSRTTSDVYTLSSSLNELRSQAARKEDVEENRARLSALADDMNILEAKVEVIANTQKEMSNVLQHVISQEAWLTGSDNDHSNTTSTKLDHLPLAVEADIHTNQSGLDVDIVENVVSEADAQELEERTNHLLTSLDRWTRVEQILHVSLSDLHTDQRRHDEEIAYLSNYTLNNALVISQLAKARIDDGGLILSLMNSTNWLSQQVYSLKSAIIQHGNTTDQLVARNEHNIGQLLALIELNSLKITALQDAVRGQGSLVESQLNYTVTQLQLLERSLNDFRTLFNTSHEALKERVMANKQRSDMLWSRFRILDNRLAHVEVKYLSEELNKYKTTNEELRQQIRVMEMEDELETVKSNIDIQQTNHESLHRRLSTVENSLQTMTSSVNELSTSWTEFTNRLPQLEELYSEVQTLVDILPADCDDVYDGGVFKSGVQLAKPGVNYTTVKLQCEIDIDVERGWTVVQYRDSGKLNFNKNWTDYKTGFGSVEVGSEFWIGNELLHVLTSNHNYSLHIDIWTVNNTYYYAEYEHFAIMSESEGYSLRVSGYSGNATDSLRHSNEMKFSTTDVDNDVSSTHCARFYTAGWWYRHCHYSNLNGRYTVGVVWFNHLADEWMELKKTTMLISRRKQTTVPS